MATVPQQSSLVTDEQAYTIECDFCTAKAGEQCINVRSIKTLHVNFSITALVYIKLVLKHIKL